MFQFDSNLTQSWSPQQSLPSTPTTPSSPASSGLGLESELFPEPMEKPEDETPSKSTRVS